jgi:hypothetical protein
MKLCNDIHTTGKVFDEDGNLIAQVYWGMAESIVKRYNVHRALVASLINCACALEKMGVITFAAELEDARNVLEVASGLGKGIFRQECEEHLSTTGANVPDACKATRVVPAGFIDDKIPDPLFNCTTCSWQVSSKCPQKEPCQSCDPETTRRNWTPRPDRIWENKA